MNFFLVSWISNLSDGFSASPVAKPVLTEDHLKIAKMCRDVYSEEVEKLETFVESKDTGIQATVGLDGSRAVVCLRGSDAVVDWKNNFNMGKVPFLSRKHSDPEMMVHTGFYIGHTSVKGKIYKKLNTIVDSEECKSILFTGHSAGIVAGLLAYDYINKKNLPIEIVTFGTPRVGNKAFVDAFDREMKCTRIINDRDLVPLAPLKVLGFHHVGNDLIHIKNGEVYDEDNGSIQKIGWRLMGLFGLDAGVRDHNISSYVEEIEKCLKKDR